MRNSMVEGRIKDFLKGLGFDAVGIASLLGFPPSPARERLLRWIEEGRFAGMGWMARTLDVRLSPDRLLPGAASAVIVALTYGRRRVNPRLKISRYATRRDYHRVFKKLLRRFVRWAEGEFGGRYFIFSDSAPVLERELATLAGLGWIGKNSMLISPHLGPNVLLGGVLTDLVLVPDDPFPYDWCGSCDRCVRACPTGAILPDRTVDANRCISYWTIEYRGDTFPEGVDTYGWIFGCDVCTDVCPWTSKTPERANPHLRAKEDRFVNLSPEDFLTMDEDTFRERFAGTPLMRAGLRGIRRNVNHLRGRAP